jgi:hypothetical protein
MHNKFSAEFDSFVALILLGKVYKLKFPTTTKKPYKIKLQQQVAIW